MLRMNKEMVIAVVQPHIEHLTTIKEWDKYAMEHDLPLATNLRHHFGSWRKAKQELGLNVMVRPYTKEDLLGIAKKHKKQIAKIRTWDEYSKEHNLPSPSTFINAFGSWANLKDEVKVEGKKGDTISKAEIRGVLKKHGKNFENRKQWDEYAKKHRLPTYKTILKHFNYEEILMLVGRTKTYNLSKEELLALTIPHKIHFLESTMPQWNQYAKEHKLPTSTVYLRVFGKWRKAKYEITMRD